VLTRRAIVPIVWLFTRRAIVPIVLAV
jgi:hypothetical protein